MPLHDAVGINCKNGTTTENHGSGDKYIWGKGCILMVSSIWAKGCILITACGLSDLT